ncbi:MAG: DUF3231 family protein [Negativicutes bacterium]|nr:DUF3231 family protein [Negativicutes bacterium]
MTIIDQVDALTRKIVQAVVDKEPIGYLEAAGLYGLILQARHNISLLSSFYNQAEDAELRALIKEAIYEQTLPAIEECEKLMRAGDAQAPDIHFPPHPLYETVDYPRGVRLTDLEIVIALGNLARNFQLTLFLTLQQCYQLEIAAAVNKLLSSGLQWDYRLLKLAIHKGWLPGVPKVEH